MNIFVLDYNTEDCARYHVNSHVCKMITESAQLLSTAHRVLDGTITIIKQNNRKKILYSLDDSREEILYKVTHLNHPCSIWARQSSTNYLWLLALLKNLLNEYTYRYDKIHATSRLLTDLSQLPINIKNGPVTPFAQAMPDKYKVKGNVVESYRNYYRHGKEHLFSWKRREQPDWI